MTILDKIQGYLPGAAAIAETALAVFKVMPGTSSVVGAIELGIKIANGVANNIPLVVQTWKDIQAAASGGKPVTEDEWAAWQAQVDEAHVSFAAAKARFDAKQ